MKMKILIIIFTLLTLNNLGTLANSNSDNYAESKDVVVKILNGNINNRGSSVLIQPGSITGKVTDAQGNPVAGATIRVKGTDIGVLTDENGKYTINNVSQKATLVISFVGLTTQEIAVSDRILIDLVMQEEAIGLQEVVVVGYGATKKINLTGAVSNVNSKVLESRPIANIGQGLQGTVSNLNITQTNGALGQGASYNIRGNTSINGGSPLILVNGVPMDVNILNPDDVENVTVLKDAASAAIYGARAAYGVILITTKAGKNKDKPRVSLSMNYSMNKPAVQFETLNVIERMDYMNEGNMRVNGVPYYQFDEYYEAAIRAHVADPVNNGETFIHPTAAANAWAFCANTDWPRVLLRDSYPQQQYTASVSGGSDKFNYYTSLSYFTEEGIAKNFNERLTRYNFMTNLNYDVTKWFTIGTKISINQSNKTYPPNDSVNNFDETYNMFQSHQWPNWPVYLPTGQYASAGSVPNVVQVQKEAGYRTRDISDTWLTGVAKLTPVKHMTFNLDYSVNIKDTEELDYRKQLPMYDRVGLTGYYPYTNPSSVTRTNYDNRYYAFNAYADYENTFGGKHYFKAMIGFNQENAYNSSFQAKREKLMVSTMPYMNLAYGERYAYDSASEFAIRGAFSRINYIFDNKYLFEFNGRYDGTSKFSKNDRWSFFPSVSLGWRIDNEAFFSGLSEHISLLKLRGSYGNLGNQAVTGNYPYIASFTSGAVPYLINSDAPMTVYAPGLVSPTLTWETVTQKDIGLDFAVLNNRLNGTIDIYRRDTKNMLTPSSTLPAVLAVNEPQANAGDMRTQGFDLTLDWKDNVGKVQYGLTFLLSDYTAEITKYSNPAGLISSYYVGSQLGEIWGLTTGGYFLTDEDAQALDQTNISARERQAGDIWFVDLNGDDKISRGKQTLSDHGDMKIIGNNTPRYNYSIRPNVSRNGFDLDILVQGTAKRDLVLNGKYFVNAYNDEWTVQGKAVADHWTVDNPNAYFPRPLVTGGSDVQAVQTHFLQNAAYMRLKQLTFGYTIPVKVTQKINVERVRVYFSGNNMWLATPMKMKKISDPEMNGATYYPLNKSYSVGVNIDF
jgi:TonB-linked SusC/RagA family outer membrane protein